MKHLIVDFYGCDTEKLKHKLPILAMLRRVCRLAKMTTLDLRGYEIKSDTDPNLSGVTALGCLKESHISFHSWGEHRYAAVDLFSCKDFDETEVIQSLKSDLESDCYTYKIVDRFLTPFEKGVNQNTENTVVV